ncbi:MAG: hypothetical protein KC421_12280 [Anaerolineales bacterium]|nr:hypothetical protein [Anaerolineales bacterium]
MEQDTNVPDENNRIEAFREYLHHQSPEQAKKLLQKLQRDLVDQSTPPLLAESSGIMVQAIDGSVTVTDTKGDVHKLNAGKKLTLLPVSLRNLSKGKNAMPVGLSHQPMPSSVLLVHIVSSRRKSSVLRLDPRGLYQNQALWGPLQLVARQQAGKSWSFSIVPGSGVEWHIEPGESIDVISVGYTPHFDVAGLFAQFNQGGNKNV